MTTIRKSEALVLKFTEIDRHDTPLVGGKGANLGEMANAGFPIPNGFCITSQSYQLMLQENDLPRQILALLKGLDVKDSTQLDVVSKKIRHLILKADIPKAITSEVLDLYRSLKPGVTHPLVAVRSSATAEDLPDASFAGQQESYLNIKGDANVMQAVRDAWASLFGSRAIFYRATQGYDHFKVSLAIPVQLMVQSDISGIMFTVNPVTNNKDQIVIEAIWGLGDYVVQGVVTPDKYLVNKGDLTLHSRQLTSQTVKEVYHYPSGVKKVEVPASDVNRVKLTDEQIIKLATIGKAIQNHYFFPQDMEWAIEGSDIYIVQARPITTIPTRDTVVARQLYSPESVADLKVILRGQPASVGISSGEVKKIKSASEIHLIQPGDILVTSMTSPDYVPAMKRAAGIITDKGGQTSHAAIVSRELGVPAIVGTKTATKVLKTGDVISLNGATGEVFAGIPKKIIHPIISHKPLLDQPRETATKVYVNLGEPDLAATVAQTDADGVGLLRAEFMIAQIGTHPKKLIHDGRGQYFIDELTKGLAKFTESFGNRPVVYRATDFKTNEYKGLHGGEAYEPTESNPMLGYRGAFRYINDVSVFELELEAIKNVRNKLGHKNLWLMIPFVRTVDEMIKVKRIISANGLTRSPSFKLWMMVEIPSNVILLEDFLNVGIDGVSIGTNDLTMLILGTDRDNETVASEFNERNPAVMWALEKIVRTSAKHGVTCSVCGQAPSMYSDLVQKLVEWGVTSVSVSPDAIERTRNLVYESERRLITHG